MIKSIFVAIITMAAFSAQAQEMTCGGQLEAEFIAQYDRVDYSYAEAGNVEHMYFGFKNFKLFQPNQTCALDFDAAQNALVELMQIDQRIQDGGIVSGILIYNPKFKTFSVQ